MVSRILVIVALAAAMSSAQSFNIDINRATGSGSGPPSSTFGGASGQTGHWNAVPTGFSGNINLVTLGGVFLTGADHQRCRIGVWVERLRSGSER